MRLTGATATSIFALVVVAVAAPHVAEYKQVPTSERSGLGNADGTAQLDVLKTHVGSVKRSNIIGKVTREKHMSTATNEVQARANNVPLTIPKSYALHDTISIDSPPQSYNVDINFGPGGPPSSALATCGEIAMSISAASEVHGIASATYLRDISHWASSSTQLAACSFEPSTTEDVAVALRILDRTRTPFAVKGGGHTTNPGFSSTVGVHIAMSRFSEVRYDHATQTVTIGAGLLWDDVYVALEPHGVNVAGGRVPGVGVAGFLLGGGYSWHTNQYGLAIDTMQMYELVMPNGTAINVTEASSPDLFFALKGGLNNFGIVTRFTLNAFRQTQVWGGFITYTGDVLDQVNQATANFVANNVDPKAVIVTTYNSLFGQPGVAQIIFYDAPTKPAGIFDEFLAIPAYSRDVSTRSFAAFVQSVPAKVTTGARGVFHSISLTDFALAFLESTVNESIYWGDTLPKSVFFVSYDVEPFHPALFTHNTTPSAYPPDRARALFPLNIYYAWLFPQTDHVVYDAIRASAETLWTHATSADACRDRDVPATVYPNYAMFDTPLVDLYGGHLQRLREIKAAVDPENVMGLAGGFKL